MGVARPNGHTPPSTCPVIVAASSGASIVAFPPSTALTFLLSSRESPHTTASTARPPTLNANVFAICAARMPHAADSVYVWLLAGSSTISSPRGATAQEPPHRLRPHREPPATVSRTVPTADRARQPDFFTLGKWLSPVLNG